MIEDLEKIKNFNFDELKNPEYKEASVREDLIHPLINALGYKSTGDFKIVREKALKHPFNMIGSKKTKISIYPDYVLEYKGKPLFIIDAKSPLVSLEKEEYISQAYSYAIHREVSAKFYALCNGYEFVLYNVNEYDPILKFRLENIDEHFETLNKIVGTNNILQVSKVDEERKLKFKKDLGIHLKMLTCEQKDAEFYYYDFPIDYIGIVDENTYSVTKNLIVEGEEYCGTFDFSYERLLELKPYLTQNEFEKLNRPSNNKYKNINLESVIKVGIKCKLGKQIHENNNEHYMPLIISNFFFY